MFIQENVLVAESYLIMSFVARRFVSSAEKNGKWQRLSLVPLAAEPFASVNV